jgi:hypothetical protein
MFKNRLHKDLYEGSVNKSKTQTPDKHATWENRTISGQTRMVYLQTSSRLGYVPIAVAEKVLRAGRDLKKEGRK